MRCRLLGQIYLNGGPGIKADGRQAFHWFLKAADQGRAGALYSLGSLFEEGNGVPRNLDLAINCYRQAAEKGDVQALMHLSELYMPGSEAGNGPCRSIEMAAPGRHARRGQRQPTYNHAVTGWQGYSSAV